MTGATYDTYNDVFKEYLVYRKLPDFRQSIIYRKHPNSVITIFLDIIDKESYTTEELEKKLKTSKGVLFNNIKEWRNLFLIEKVGDLWVIPKSVLESYSKFTLGDYIRRHVLDNDVVVKLLGKISLEQDMSIDMLSAFIKDQFPFVDATDQTWDLYASILRSWLTNLCIIKIDQYGIISTAQIRREDIIEELGNMKSIKKRRRGGSDIFLPSVSWNSVEDCFTDILNGEIPMKGEKSKARNDLKNGEWFIENELIFEDLESFKKEVRDLLLSDPYNTIWEAAKKGNKLFPIIQGMISVEYSEETLKWRLKKLINWAKAFEIIESKRYQY